MPTAELDDLGGDAPTRPRRTRAGRMLRSRSGRWLVWLLPRVVSLISRVLFRTCRITFVGKQHEDQFIRNGRAIVFAGLHEGMVLLPFHFRDRRGGVVMVSPSRDGDIIAGTIERFGLRPVRGSSGRHGGTALHAIIAALRTSPVSAGIIVDGPRGPALEAKVGALVIARETGLPVVPGTWWSNRLLRAKSWDRTIVPLPFTRIVFAFEEAICVPADATDADLEAYRAELTRRLLAARARAQAACGVRDASGGDVRA